MESHEPELPESTFSFDTPRYSNLYFFKCTHINIFNQQINLDSFVPEADCLFLNTIKYDLYIGIGILISQKW